MFLLPELTAQAQNHLYRISQNMIIEAQTAFYVADDSDEQFEMSELEGYFDGVKMVYEDNYLEHERKCFTDIVKYAHFWPLLDTNFKNKAEAHHDFWVDVMSLQQKAITDGAYWPYLKPEECHRCEHSPWRFKDHPRSTHWATLMLFKGKCQAICNQCASEDYVNKEEVNHCVNEKEARKLWSELWREEDEEERKLPPVVEESGKEEASSSSSGGSVENGRLTSARKVCDEVQEDRKKLEWLLKVGGSAIPSETRKTLWEKVDKLRQAAQGYD